jgi:hypothetical protein
MQPEINSYVHGLMGRLSDDECHELSRLCASIFENQPIQEPEHEHEAERITS